MMKRFRESLYHNHGKLSTGYLRRTEESCGISGMAFFQNVQVQAGGLPRGDGGEQPP